jgi:hypothetical protein
VPIRIRGARITDIDTFGGKGSAMHNVSPEKPKAGIFFDVGGCMILFSASYSAEKKSLRELPTASAEIKSLSTHPTQSGLDLLYMLH